MFIFSIMQVELVSKPKTYSTVKQKYKIRIIFLTKIMLK